MKRRNFFKTILAGAVGLVTGKVGARAELQEIHFPAVDCEGNEAEVVGYAAAGDGEWETEWTHYYILEDGKMRRKELSWRE